MIFSLKIVLQITLEKQNQKLSEEISWVEQKLEQLIS